MTIHQLKTLRPACPVAAWRGQGLIYKASFDFGIFDKYRSFLVLKSTCLMLTESRGTAWLWPVLAEGSTSIALPSSAQCTNRVCPAARQGNP